MLRTRHLSKERRNIQLQLKDQQETLKKPIPSKLKMITLARCKTISWTGGMPVSLVPSRSATSTRCWTQWRRMIIKWRRRWSRRWRRTIRKLRRCCREWSKTTMTWCSGIKTNTQTVNPMRFWRWDGLFGGRSGRTSCTCRSSISALNLVRLDSHPFWYI